MEWRFKNREEAGQMLAETLSEYSGSKDLIVLALPRGGVPVAFEVAQKLGAPLGILVVRKLGVPGQEELAFGAIASGGGRVLNENLVRALGLTSEMIERITERERTELHRREAAYHTVATQPDVAGRTVIVVDDGLATGATMRAAIAALRSMRAKSIVVAVPVGSRETCSALTDKADVICVCAMTPEPFYGVGMWYQDFSQTTDEEVRELLSRAGTHDMAFSAV